MGISEGLSRMSWKLSRTVLRGGVTGNGGSLLGERIGDRKQPNYIHMADNGLMAFAGLWDQWRDPGDENLLESFSIMTTSANELLSPIHDRMPVILHPEAFSMWLDKDLHDPEHLRQLYQPYPVDQ